MEKSMKDPESQALSLYLAQKGVDILRVHNAPLHQRAHLHTRAMPL